MAKLSISRVLESSRLLATEAGQQLSDLIEFINDLSDNVIRTLRQGLTFQDNFKCQISTVTLTHNVEQRINDNGNTVFAIMPVRTYSTQYGIDSFLWFKNDSGQSVVKASFTGAPSAPVSTVLILFFE